MSHQAGPGIPGLHSILIPEATIGFRADPDPPDGKYPRAIQLSGNAPIEGQKARWSFANALDFSFDTKLGAMKMDMDLVPGSPETDMYRLDVDFSESPAVSQLRVWMPYELRRFYNREFITAISQADDKTISVAAANIPVHVVYMEFDFQDVFGNVIGPTGLHLVGRFVTVDWTYQDIPD